MNPPFRTILSTWREPGEVAIKSAETASNNGQSLTDLLVAGLTAAELDPNLVAIGLGALPNADGVLELDASIMDGRDLSAGAVCSVQDICPVIRLAELVRTQTPHVMLSGSQARRFALENGFESQDLNREPSMAKFAEWKKANRGFERADYIHSVGDFGDELVPALETTSGTDASGQHTGDTVTMLAHESVGTTGHVAAASSTSGLSWKLPGRVGDSPIIGAGIYADDEAGCAGATGFGEELWKGVASFRTVEMMRAGLHPQAACEETIRHINKRQPNSRTMQCVVLALDRMGNYGAAVNIGEFTLWVYKDSKTQSISYKGLFN